MASKLSAELRLDLKKFRANLAKAVASVRRFARTVGLNAAKGIGNAIRGAAGFIKSALKFALITGTVGAVLAATKTVLDSVREAIASERILMRFDILAGGKDAAAKLFSEIRADALRTGASVSTMAGSISKFMASGFSADEALKLNRGMLDVAGSVGMTSAEIGLLGSALSQVAAKSVASMEELRQQIAEKGVPIFDALADKLTGGDKALVIKKISLGEVSAKQVLDMFSNLEGGFAKFRGGAEKMAGTFGGQVSVMKTGWSEFLRKMGDPIRDALRPILTGAISLIGKLRESALQIGNAVGGGVDKAIAAFQVLRSMPLNEIGATLGAALEIGAVKFGNVIAGVAAALGDILGGAGFWKPMADALLNIVAEVGRQMTGAFKDTADAFREALFGPKEVNRSDLEIEQARGGRIISKTLDPDVARRRAVAAEVRGGDFADAVRSAFAQARDGADVFQASVGAKDQIRRFNDNLKEQLGELRGLREALKHGVGGVVGKTISSTKGTGKLAGGFATTGSIGRMMNVLAGRSANEVLASEARRTNDHLARANATLLSMSKKLDRKQPLTMNTRMPMASALFA